MSILVIAEHDNNNLKGSTLNTVMAATMLSGEITLLVAGSNIDNVISESKSLDGVSKILKSNRRKNSELNLHKFIMYLKKIGYNMEYSNSGELSKFIKIFQMRFRPELIDGKLDLECFYIAKSLYKLE